MSKSGVEREGIILINGVRLWTSSQGDGVPVVLCHGGPGGYDYLKPVADMIDDVCQVIRYDQRGSGRSEVKGPYDVSTFVDDLEAIRKHFGFDRWIVGGHSWGAGLALSYAAEFTSRTRAIIYLSGPGIDPAWHDEYGRNRLAALPDNERGEFKRIRAERDHATGSERERIQKRIRELSRKTDAYDPTKVDAIPDFQEYPTNNEVNRIVTADWFSYLESEDYRETIYRLQVPTLFFHGLADPRSARFVEELAGRLVDDRFHSIAEAGHYPWIEKPEEVRKVIRSFISLIHKG